jgi:hypothetical protein
MKPPKIDGNKVHVSLKLKRKITTAQLDDAVKNVIKLLKKQNYKFKSSNTIKMNKTKKTKKNTSKRKTSKQKGGNYDKNINIGSKTVKEGDIISFLVNHKFDDGKTKYIKYKFIGASKKKGVSYAIIKFDIDSSIIHDIGSENQLITDWRTARRDDVEIDVNQIISETIEIHPKE